MNIVEPIRKKSDLKRIEKILKKQSLRDLLLFTVGTNCGLRISDILNLKKLIREDGNGYVLDDTNIKTKKIRKAVDDFQNYIISTNEKVFEYVAKEYELELDLEDKDFWEKCLNTSFFY